MGKSVQKATHSGFSAFQVRTQTAYIRALPRLGRVRHVHTFTYYVQPRPTREVGRYATCASEMSRGSSGPGGCRRGDEVSPNDVPQAQAMEVKCCVPGISRPSSEHWGKSPQ